jgi:Transglycosylase SLT domain
LLLLTNTWKAVRLIACDTRDGCLEIGRNGFALLGLVVVALTLTLTLRPPLQESATAVLMAWLQARQLPTPWSSTASFAALQRTTAGDPLDLPADQASVTYWLSHKYSVAPEPLSVLVAEAFNLGERAHIAPTLILAMVAIESNFNPYAQNTLGGQGLMQIQPAQQSEKLDSLGGALATFDPLSNLRVGVRVLHELAVEKGSIQAGLAAYAESTRSREGPYLERVLQEEQRLTRVSQSVRQARAPATEPATKLAPPRWQVAPKAQSISL